MSGLNGILGGNDRNRKAVTQEYLDWEKYRNEWDARDKQRRKNYKFEKKAYDHNIAFDEQQKLHTEVGQLEAYRSRKELQDFEFISAAETYNKSVRNKDKQVGYNKIAEAAAFMEQAAKKRDDLLSVAFDETDTLIEHAYATTGLKVNRHNKLVEADIEEARFENQYTKDIADQDLQRSQSISESQIEAQKSIIDGMKAAGAIRSRGSAGRSSAKAAIAVMAESGANRAAISNALMYAEQGIDLNIAQIKDKLILDQTMVLAARDAAENTYTLESTKLDTSLAVDKLKISETRKSIELRDSIVRKKIKNARLQADLNAEAAVMMEPKPLPAITDPRELYKIYDNPETAHVEMLVRPIYQEFPEYESEPKLEWSDFKGSRGREDTSWGFSDVLAIGGAAAFGVGGAAMIGGAGLGAGASSGVFGLTAGQGKILTTVGTQLWNNSSSR